MRRIILWWAIIGLVVPMMILLVGHLQGGIFAWPRVALMMWPTWILNAATFGRESSILGVSVLIISISANALLYALVGLLLWGLLPKHFRPVR